jgi:hypothetical protein
MRRILTRALCQTTSDGAENTERGPLCEDAPRSTPRDERNNSHAPLRCNRKSKDFFLSIFLIRLRVCSGGAAVLESGHGDEHDRGPVAMVAKPHPNARGSARHSRPVRQGRRARSTAPRVAGARSASRPRSGRPGAGARAISWRSGRPGHARERPRGGLADPATDEIVYSEVWQTRQQSNSSLRRSGRPRK